VDASGGTCRNYEISENALLNVDSEVGAPHAIADFPARVWPAHSAGTAGGITISWLTTKRASRSFQA